MSGGVLMIGVGNALRGDDAAGLHVAQRLRDAPPGGCTVLEHEGEPLALLDTWASAQAVVLVDALRCRATPGTLHRLDVGRSPVPAVLRGATSTHAVGLGDAIELARELRRLPSTFVVLGVEGRCFDTGAPLSPEVAAALEPLTAMARTHAGRFSGCGPRRPGRS